LKQEPRVQTYVNAKGDTLIEMKLIDAKSVLDDLLDKQVSDSLVDVYASRDSINQVSIALQADQIKTLNETIKNQGLISDNLTTIVSNKDKEISDLNDIIKQQKKEIRKQKILKIIGFTAAVVLPIGLLVLLLH
jgi:uncharacterized coiled-coil protein SlyX